MPIARIVTGSVLIAVVLLCLFVFPITYSAAIFALFLFGGALEWATMAGVAGLGPRLVYALMIAFGALACWHFGRADGVLVGVLEIACGWWLMATILIFYYQRSGKSVFQRLPSRLAAGVVILIPAYAAIIFLLNRGPDYLLGSFGIVWSADILAYFGGRRFGHRRLASRVSPGKTWAGFYSAVFGTLVLGMVFCAALGELPYLTAALIITLTLIAAITGDLFESLFKRLVGVKDSGRSLPGHGGIMDRIDSLVAAAPVFAFTLRLMGYA